MSRRTFKRMCRLCLTGKHLLCEGQCSCICDELFDEKRRSLTPEQIKLEHQVADLLALSARLRAMK